MFFRKMFIVVAILLGSVSVEAIEKDGVTYGTVVSPYTGKVWLDRNLGASRVCANRYDESCVGYFYQWGRKNDGHQYINSGQKVAKLSSIMDITSAFVVNFIYDAHSGNTSNYRGDWVVDGQDDDGSIRNEMWSRSDGSSICPIGFRVPTQDELANEQNGMSAFDDFLKLPMSFLRAETGWSWDSSIGIGFLWSSDFKKAIAYSKYRNGLSSAQYALTYGMNVRCIKSDTTGPINGIIDAQVSDEYKKQPIERDPKNTFANTFRVHLQSGGDSGDICDDYTFKVVADEGRGATMTKCVYDSNTFSKDEITIDFRIDKKDGGYYFENGKIRVTEKSTGKSEDLTVFKNFNVYGTSFNLKRDAFSFNNGDWNKANTVNYNRFNFISYVNDIAKITHTVEGYLVGSIEKESLWDSVGYYRKELINSSEKVSKDKTLFSYKGKISQGLCYGMALSSAANFIYKNKKVWGTNKSLNDFDSEIENHWKTYANEVRATDGLKPFSKYTYKYAKNDFQALKKILYYFVSQPSFVGVSDSWIAKEKHSTGNDDLSFMRNYRHLIEPIIKKNMPMPFVFYYNFGGGHAILNTQIIEYNDKRNLYFYDNSDNSSYTLLKSNTLGNHGKYRGDTIRGMARLDYLNDALKIYPDTLRGKEKNKNLLSKRLNQKIENGKLDYRFRKHIKIRVVGGSFTEVREASNNRKVILRPLGSTIEEGIAYREEANIFNNVLLLPANKKYKITLKKKAGFVTLKVFVTIPKDDGTAEYLSYNNVETSTNDATVATLVVGRNNTDKKIKRTGASSQSPSFDKQYGLELLPPSKFSVFHANGDVAFFWSDEYVANNANYDATVIIRKKGASPKNITDGTLIYKGSDTHFMDEGVAFGNDYYYGIYNISVDGKVTDMKVAHIDTSKYSIFTLNFWYDTYNYPNMNIKYGTIMLYNEDKSELLQEVQTNNMSGFSFNNLLPGKYVISFLSSNWHNNDVKVLITSESVSLDVYPETLSRLYIDVRSTVEVGSTYKILWDGESIIPDQNKVKIELYRNRKWETIANNISYNKHEYDWQVSGVGGEMKLRLSESYEVSVEKDIFIISNKDTDKDGIPNYSDTDDDNDGISDIVEIANGLNPLDASDAQADLDHDGFSNAIEISVGTDIRNANSKPVWVPIMMGDIITFVPAKR